eukprot:Gb_41176 [translate_table: standard]
MDNCVPFGSLKIMMGHPSLRYGTRRLPEAASSNGMVGISDGNTMDAVILSNGPGEELTYVKPVVNALQKHFNVERLKLLGLEKERRAYFVGWRSIKRTGLGKKTSL